MAEVTIYTRMMCGFCSAAKRLLDKKGVTYTEHDVTFEPSLRNEMIEKSQGARTFPQIFIGNSHIGGCDQLYALDREGRLDALLGTGEPA